MLIIFATSSLAQPSGGIVRRVDWNNTGSKIAAGHDTGLVEVIDSATGQLLQSFQLPYVLDVAWSPHNSDLLAVATADIITTIGAIYILDTAAGQEIAVLIGEEQIYSVTWKPDGSQVVGAVDYITSPGPGLLYLTIWETSNWQIDNHITVGPLEILSLDWSPDGNYIAGGGVDQNITIWDAATGAVVSTLEGHTRGVHAVAWSPDGSRLASASAASDPTIRIWDAVTGQSLLMIPDSGAYDIAWSPDSTRIAAAKVNNIVRVWDAFTGQLVDTITQPNKVYTVAWSPDGGRLAFGDDGGTAPIIHFPAADAGPDQTVTAADGISAQVTLDGSGSYDPDGEIVSYVWAIDEVEIATGVNPIVALDVGVHVITLTVIDDDGASDSDQVTITVETPAVTCDTTITAGDVTGLKAAITSANGAGSAQTICLEAGTFTLTSVDHTSDGPNGLPSITGNVTLHGLDDGATITRDVSAPLFRIARVHSSGQLKLSNITISNGNPGGSNNGGGIRSLGTLELINTIIENNTARDGGGGILSYDTLTLTDTILDGNLTDPAVGLRGELADSDRIVIEALPEGASEWVLLEELTAVTSPKAKS
jgi:WD40 repeat protein